MFPAFPFSLREGRDKNHRSPSCAPQTPPPASSSEQLPDLASPPAWFHFQYPVSLWALCLCEGPETPRFTLNQRSQIPKHLRHSGISLCPGVLPGCFATLLASDSECCLRQAPASILPPTFLHAIWRLSLSTMDSHRNRRTLSPRMATCLSTPAAQRPEAGLMGLGPSPDLSHGPVFPEGTGDLP